MKGAYCSERYFEQLLFHYAFEIFVVFEIIEVKDLRFWFLKF